LGQLGFDLGSFDRSASQLISLLLPGLDLPSDFERQLDSRGSQFLRDQHADGFVDGATRDRLTIGLAAAAARSVADVP
jgi:hypothetical protein